MAQIGELTVAFSADTKDLQAGIKQAGQTVKQSGDQIQKAFSGKSVQSIGNTTSAVVNFNRVIQDAPFGILGVSNNIEPLITSFNGLRSSTGSAGGAIKTLLKSAFTGPGALITITSIASTALLVLSRNMGGIGDAGKKAKTGVDVFTKSIQDQIDAINKLQFGGDEADQLRAAENQKRIYEDALAQLEQMADVNQDINFKSAIYGGNITGAIVSKINDLLGTSVNQGEKQKIVTEAINGLREKITETEGKILGLQLLQNVELEKSESTTSSMITNIDEYNDAILRAKQSIVGAGTALRDNLLLEGIIEPQKPLTPLLDIIEEIERQTKNAFGKTLPQEISKTKAISDAFTVSFSQGLADVIMQSKKLSDVLKDIGMTLLRSGLAKILEAALFGGTTTATGGILGNVFPKLFGAPVSAMATAPTITGANMTVGGQFVLRGTDLVATINKTNSTTLR